MPTALPGLVATVVAVDSPVHLAQRYLASAYDSVASLIETTYPVLRAVRTGSRGRLTHPEQDLFRAAVVFTGAGVDTVLKQALRSCIPVQVERSEAAKGKYLEFVASHIQNGSAVDVKQLALLLTSGAPEVALRESYVRSLTGSSLQSESQVTSTLAALGLSDRDLFRDAKTLGPLFRIRNQIAHEMDMTDAAIKGRGSRTRHERALKTYVDVCHSGLNYSQRVLNALEGELADS